MTLSASEPTVTAVRTVNKKSMGEVWGWCLSWSSKPVGLLTGTGRFDSYLLPP